MAGSAESVYTYLTDLHPEDRYIVIQQQLTNNNNTLLEQQKIILRRDENDDTNLFKTAMELQDQNLVILFLKILNDLIRFLFLSSLN